MAALAWRSLARHKQLYRAPRGALGPPVVLRSPWGTPGTPHVVSPARGVATTPLNFARYSTEDAATSMGLHLQRSDERLKFYPAGETAGNPGRHSLVILFNWLMAKEKHIMNYVNLYNKLGVSVLTVTTTPTDLLFPTRGTQVVTRDLMNLLLKNDRMQPILVHGFSVGAYAFSEAMMHAMHNMDQFRPLLKRFVGQVWDCPVDLNGVAVGFPMAVTSIPVLERFIRACIRTYMDSMYESVTIHYEKAREPFFTNTLGVPVLLFQSSRDPISTEVMTQELVKGWKERGTKVTYKCFEEGPHVSLYWKNPTEYEQLLMEFLEDVKLVRKS